MNRLTRHALAPALVLALALLAACSSQEKHASVVDAAPAQASVLPPSGGDPSALDSTVATSPGAGASAARSASGGPSALDPSALDPSAASSTTSPLAQFRTVTVHLTKADGTSIDWCLLLADTQQLRELGLQGVRQLEGFDGMLFRFADDQNGGFWMHNTLVPLSIAFFGAGGAFVSATDMDPCPLDPSAPCELHHAAGPYADAIEVLRGGLAAAAIAAGTTLVVGEQGCRRG